MLHVTKPSHMATATGESVFKHTKSNVIGIDRNCERLEIFYCNKSAIKCAFVNLLISVNGLSRKRFQR